ncbi:7845_t:CDS:2 [Gigaspora rosea]|nr:7845_t:CDS:2 [Gigaspora rosea]
METELEEIPKKDYRKIEVNTVSLNIPESYELIIYGFNKEFLTKHVLRRKLPQNSPERIKIETENRDFLENYWKAKANLATSGARCGKGGKSILGKGLENIATKIN